MINRYYPLIIKTNNNNNNNQKLYYSNGSNDSNINEWRERIFDTITEVDNVLASMDNKNNDDNGSFSSSLPREIYILPFSCKNVLLQGETKQIYFNEEK